MVKGLPSRNLNRTNILFVLNLIVRENTCQKLWFSRFVLTLYDYIFRDNAKIHCSLPKLLFYSFYNLESDGSEIFSGWPQPISILHFLSWVTFFRWFGTNIDVNCKIIAGLIPDHLQQRTVPATLASISQDPVLFLFSKIALVYDAKNGQLKWVLNY